MSNTATLTPSEGTEAAHNEAPQQLTHELFLHHVRAMATHYKGGTPTSGPTHVYALPTALLHPVDAEGHLAVAAVIPAAAIAHSSAPSPQQQMQQAATAGKTSTEAFVQKQKDYASQQTNALQQSKNTGDFAAKMNAQRAKAKQDSDANIDKIYDTFEKLGTAHPALQSTILSTLQKIGTWMTSLLSSVVTFFSNLVAKIVDWIKKAVVWAQNAAKTIADWATGAASAVGNFFSHIF